MRICRDLKGVIVGWVRLLGGSVTMSKGGFVRVSVKENAPFLPVTSRMGPWHKGQVTFEMSVI